MIQFRHGTLGQVCLALIFWASTTGGSNDQNIKTQEDYSTTISTPTAATTSSYAQFLRRQHLDDMFLSAGGNSQSGHFNYDQIDDDDNFPFDRRNQDIFNQLGQPSIVLPSNPQGLVNCAGLVCNENSICNPTGDGCYCRDNFLDMSPVGTNGKICLKITTIGCPSGWDTLAGTTRCYRVFRDDGLQRPEASARCRREQPNAELATIPSKTLAVYTTQKIGNAITKKGSHKKAWIGLIYDPARKKWAWPDGAVANFTAWFYFGGPADPEGDDRMCTQLVAGQYGTGSWISEACENGNETSSAAAFMCDVPRLIPPSERPLASHKSFEITCCKKGTPKVDEDIRPFVSNWVVTDFPQGVTYDEGCWRYTGSFLLDESALMPHQDASVKCECPGPGLDSRCNDNQECVNGYRAYKIGLRCSCQDPYFGKLCELLCDNGQRTKVNGFDVCECHEHYYGEECNKIKCLNGGTPNRNQRSCRCVSEKFTGRHCEYKRFNGEIEESQHSDADDFNRNIGGTAAGILFIIGMGLGIYCCARRRANSIMRQLTDMQLQQRSRTMSHLSSAGDGRGDGNLAYTPSELSSSNTTFASSNSGYTDRDLYFMQTGSNPHPGGNPQGGITVPPHLMDPVGAPPSYDETQTMTPSSPPGGNLSLSPGIIGNVGTPVLPPDLAGSDLPTYEDVLKLYHPLTSNNSPIYNTDSTSAVPIFVFQPQSQPQSPNIADANNLNVATSTTSPDSDNNNSISNNANINNNNVISNNQTDDHNSNQQTPISANSVSVPSTGIPAASHFDGTEDHAGGEGIALSEPHPTRDAYSSSDVSGPPGPRDEYLSPQ